MAEIILTLSGALVLGSLLVLINIFSATHPYHKPLPLVISSLLVMSVGLYISMATGPEGATVLDSMRQSTSLAITGLIASSPVLFAILTLLMVRISFWRNH